MIYRAYKDESTDSFYSCQKLLPSDRNIYLRLSKAAAVVGKYPLHSMLHFRHNSKIAGVGVQKRVTEKPPSVDLGKWKTRKAGTGTETEIRKRSSDLKVSIVRLDVNTE